MRQVTSNTLIVSMTTYPERMRFQTQVWDSILRWRMDKDVHFVIVLSHEEFYFRLKEFNDIFEYYKKNNIEVLWTVCDTRSYKKFFPTYRKYNQNDILVIDDDIIRTDDFLDVFLKYREIYPGEILARHAAHFITASNSIKFFNYVLHNDEHSCHLCNLIGAKFFNVKPANGLGGCLYPANCFGKIQVILEHRYFSKCSTSDESILFTLAIKNHVWTRIIPPEKDSLSNQIDGSQDGERVLKKKNKYHHILADIEKWFPFQNELMNNILENIKFFSSVKDYLKEKDYIPIYCTKKLSYKDFTRLIIYHLEHTDSELEYNGARIRPAGDYDLNLLEHVKI